MVTTTLYESLFQELPVPACLIDTGAQGYPILGYNRSFGDLFGNNQPRLTGQKLFEALPQFVIPGKANDMAFLIDDVIKSRSTHQITFRLTDNDDPLEKKASSQRLTMTATPLPDNQNDLDTILLTLQMGDPVADNEPSPPGDQTGQILEWLREVNEKLEIAQRIGNLGYWEHILATDELFWSNEVYRIFGLDKQTFQPDVHLLQEKMHPDDKEEFYRKLRLAMRGEIEHNIEYRILLPDGSTKWVNEKGALTYNSEGKAIKFEGTLQDISDKKESEEVITQSLKEKEILLAEIHHRVKNNLAVVSSLLEVQAMNKENEQLKDELLNATLRIHSIASIHEQLYQSDNFHEIKFSNGIEKLVMSVVETMHVETDVFVDFDLDEVSLSINQGIPCSLLVNEIITNIIKHAFKGRKKGDIRVRLKQKESDTLRIQIDDNGRDLPDNFEQIATESIGLVLIDRLTEQLSGSHEYSPRPDGHGTRFILDFPVS